ncbi:MAG: diaminopimelate epimerase [Clostridium sp.]|nr:diaminopimelate epimerase [Prevotella sp.]MCM1429221.1 diaminopimelate epimerase [Clostridium sp.]MCM1475806.1 diaminopimelate epimerase [Muribaculaceae bacterium]
MKKSSVKFSKMHGAGNDYIYIDAREKVPDNLPLLSRQISSRHFGIGSDGLVAIMQSETADFRMRMFNADGSEAQMCGNASRCIGKYVYEKGLTEKTTLTLETLAGIRVLELEISDGLVKSVRVDMGKPQTAPEAIPVVSTGGASVINREYNVDGLTFRLTAVGMGNPHGVIFTDRITDFQVLELGPKLETADFWPQKANIEFVRIIDRSHIEMRVWERGSGETLACGTGACAAVVAAVSNGLTDREVDVTLPGGKLHVSWDAETEHVYLSGGAEFIAEGEFYPESAMRADII